jgi:hypothetical protein
MNGSAATYFGVIFFVRCFLAFFPEGFDNVVLELSEVTGVF